MKIFRIYQAKLLFQAQKERNDASSCIQIYFDHKKKGFCIEYYMSLTTAKNNLNISALYDIIKKGIVEDFRN